MLLSRRGAVRHRSSPGHQFKAINPKQFTEVQQEAVGYILRDFARRGDVDLRDPRRRVAVYVNRAGDLRVDVNDDLLSFMKRSHVLRLGGRAAVGQRNRDKGIDERLPAWLDRLRYFLPHEWRGRLELVYGDIAEMKGKNCGQGWIAAAMLSDLALTLVRHLWGELKGLLKFWK